MGESKPVEIQRKITSEVEIKLLNPSRHLAVVGAPGSGKSVVIDQAAKSAKVQYKDFGIDWKISDLAEKVEKYAGKPGSKPKIAVVRKFQAVADEAKSQSELEVLGMALYDVAQKANVKLVFEMDRRVSEALNVAAPKDSALSALFETVYIKPFDDDELQEVVKSYGVKADDKVVKWLLNRTGGFPKLAVSYLDAACSGGRVLVTELNRLADDVGSVARAAEVDWLGRVERFLARHSFPKNLLGKYKALNWLQLLAQGSQNIPLLVRNELKACGIIGSEDQILGILAECIMPREIIVDLDSMCIDICNIHINMTQVPVVFAFSVMALNGVTGKASDFCERLNKIHSLRKNAGADPSSKKFPRWVKSVGIDQGPECFRQIRDRLEVGLSKACHQECRLVSKNSCPPNWGGRFTVKWKNSSSGLSEKFPADQFDDEMVRLLLP